MYLVVYNKLTMFGKLSEREEFDILEKAKQFIISKARDGVCCRLFKEIPVRIDVSIPAAEAVKCEAE